MINIFSVPDYCGKYGNCASMIKIKKNFEIQPCTLNPQMGKKLGWLEGIKTSVVFTEEEAKLRKRPPTPPKKLNAAKML